MAPGSRIWDSPNWAMPKRRWCEDDDDEIAGRIDDADVAGEEPIDFEIDERNPDAATVGIEFIEGLIQLRMIGNLSARIVCVLAWWASRAGATGPCHKIGHHPWERSIGNYQKNWTEHLASKKPW